MTYPQFGATKLDPRVTGADQPTGNTVSDELGAGISRGLRGAGGQLEQIAGLGGEALGATDFAQQRYAAAKSLREAAADPRFASQTPTFDNVHSVGDFARWGAGKVGEMAPVLGAAVAGGVLTGNPIVGGTLAMTPFEAGDIAQRQQADPRAAGMGAGERLLRAGAGGLASSAMMNAMPAGLAGKFAGAGIRGEKLLAPAILKNVGEGAAINAAGMGASEATKQMAVNEQNPLDQNALEEAALGGAVVGGVAHAPVGVASYLKGATEGIKPSAIAGSIADRLAARKAAAEAPVEPVAPEPVAVPSGWDQIGDLLKKGREKVDDTVDRVKNGTPLGDLSEYATAQGQRLKDLVDGSENQTVQKVKEWGQDMLDKLPETDGRVDQIKQYMADATDRASQVGIATMKKAMDLGQQTSEKVSAFADSAKGLARLTGLMGDGAKKSEDYSGAHAVILQALHDSGISKSRPDLFASNKSINDMASALRMVGEELPRGPLSSDVIAKAIDVFGPDTQNVLQSVVKALSSGKLDPQATEAMFHNISQIDALQKSSGSLHEFVGGALTDEAKGSTLSSDIPKLSDLMVRHAKGELTAGKGPAETQATNARMAELMKEHFGDKADAVSRRVEKEAGSKTVDEPAAKEGGVDANGDRVEAEQLDRIVIGHGKNNAKMVDPDIFKAQKRQGLNHAQQALLDAKAKYPDREVRFERTEGSKEWGHVVAEKAADPNSFNPAELESMKHDTKKYPNSPSRLKIGDMNIDAVKVAKVMRDKGAVNFDGPSKLSSKERLADAFKQGIAQLIEQSGKSVDVPDTAVIGFVGGNKLTWGEARRLTRDTAENRMSATGQAKLQVLRDEYKTAGPKDKLKILKEAQQLHDFEKDRELSNDPNSPATSSANYAEKMGDTRTSDRPEAHDNKDTRYDADGNLTKEGAHDLLTGRRHGGLDPRELELRKQETTDERGAKTPVGEDRIRSYERGDQGQGRTEIGFDENPHLTAAVHGEKMQRGANMDGSGQHVSDRASTSEAISNLANEFKARSNKAQQAIGAKLAEVLGKVRLNEADLGRLSDVLADKKPSAVAAIVNELAEKYASAKTVKKAKVDPEGSPDPKAVAAKKAAFLERAASGDKALIKELGTSTDAKGLQRAAEALAEHAPDSEAMKAVNERLSTLIQDPDVAYGLGTKKYCMESAEATDPNLNHASGSRPDIAEHIEKVLGKSTRLAWANLTHAGEYAHAIGQGVIRLSVHALDPMSTAYHESLHAFFGQLRDAGAHDVTGVLEKAASSEHVLAQLRERFKNEPAVLKQLSNPEERAAYMYQMWANDPTFKVSIAAKGVFGKIADYIRKAMGVWTNDQRALHIMEYFNSGEYGKNLGHQSAVRRALMQPGRNQAWDSFHAIAQPLAHMADSMAGVGVSRVRDMGIPALNELADHLKRDHLDGSRKDQGFIAASRIEATKRRTALGEQLGQYTDAQLRDAMDGLQHERPAATPEGRLAAREIKTFLGETRDYMVKAGVDVGNLGPDYFPRVWDTHYIGKNLQAFRDMLEPYVRRGEMTGKVDDLITNLLNRDGNEFGIETREPGMQFTKERKLDFISPADAAEFVNKDLHGTLNSYLTQATRKAEWNRRLGGGKLEQLWADAKDQGATAEDLAVADRFMKGVDGTLGDNLNPHARRIMGNMIVYQNIRLLPMAAFSMLIDPNGVMVRGGTVGEGWSTFKRGMRDLTKAWSKDGPAMDESTRMAELVGVIDSAMMSHTMGDLYTQGMVGGTAKAINNAFFKYNLVESLNRSFRIGASEAAMSFIARHADGTASPHSQRWMDELNLSKNDVKLTPDGRIALTEGEGLTKGQVTKVHAAINQWVDGAVLRPDAADKPIWMNDPRYALFAHLKQFVFSFQKTILERVIHEAQHKNYTPAMALASYVPVMMAADFAKGMIQNGGSQPDYQAGWGPADFVGYGMQRAGLFGVGQFGLDIMKDMHHGNTGAFALAGPTMEQLRDGVETLGGHKQFGTTAINAMPANALFKHSLGEGDNGGPMFAD